MELVCTVRPTLFVEGLQHRARTKPAARKGAGQVVPRVKSF